MARLLRNPLTWMVVAECVVVAALAFAAWQLIASSRGPGGAVAQGVFPPVASAEATGAPALPTVVAPPAATGRGPLPGLNVTIAFWRSHIALLNREEAAFEALEWKIADAVMSAAQRYLESVVLPAARRAAHPGGGRHMT